ncbi:MAG TPA: hypothetical protein VK762_09540 [Polyangiaceae bacterium]|nr:hypothetical protein [Polyangiaceae bacterium]
MGIAAIGGLERHEAETSSKLDDELRALLARVRPSPAELISLWPSGKRKHVALFIRESSGAPLIVARLREDPPDHHGADARRTRSTVPVTFELDDGRTVVVPLRLLEAA